LWNDYRHDFRVNSVSEVMQARLVKFWTLHREGHLVGASLEQLAWELHLDVAEVQATLEALTAAGLLEADRTPHGWERRQRPYDDAAARMRQYRRRRRDERESPSPLPSPREEEIREEGPRADPRSDTRSAPVRNAFVTPEESQYPNVSKGAKVT
jgi:hypothetical protein